MATRGELSKIKRFVRVYSFCMSVDVRYKESNLTSAVEDPKEYYSLDVFELVDLNDPAVLSFYSKV